MIPRAATPSPRIATLGIWIPIIREAMRISVCCYHFFFPR
jgi:hypothetical protein